MKLAIPAVLALSFLPACGAFTPSPETIRAHCVVDPTAKKAAARAGMSVEEFCDKLIEETRESEQSGGACTDGGCPVPK